ncbi:hypothetical protein GW915_11660 [bacterium]|nr:hypothetical protein [bacterium]
MKTLSRSRKKSGTVLIRPLKIDRSKRGIDEEELLEFMKDSYPILKNGSFQVKGGDSEYQEKAANTAEILMFGQEHLALRVGGQIFSFDQEGVREHRMNTLFHYSMRTSGADAKGIVISLKDSEWTELLDRVVSIHGQGKVFDVLSNNCNQFVCRSLRVLPESLPAGPIGVSTVLSFAYLKKIFKGRTLFEVEYQRPPSSPLNLSPF